MYSNSIWRILTALCISIIWFELRSLTWEKGKFLQNKDWRSFPGHARCFVNTLIFRAAKYTPACTCTNEWQMNKTKLAAGATRQRHRQALDNTAHKRASVPASWMKQVNNKFCLNKKLPLPCGQWGGGKYLGEEATLTKRILLRPQTEISPSFLSIFVLLSRNLRCPSSILEKTLRKAVTVGNRTTNDAASNGRSRPHQSQNKLFTKTRSFQERRRLT